MMQGKLQRSDFHCRIVTVSCSKQLMCPIRGSKPTVGTQLPQVNQTRGINR